MVVRGRSDTGELSLQAWREPGQERRANAVGHAVSDLGRDQTSECRNPHKRRRWKLSQQLQGKNIGYILCKVHVWKWPIVNDKHVKKKPIIYVLGPLFLFDLDGECKFIKNKTL